MVVYQQWSHGEHLQLHSTAGMEDGYAPLGCSFSEVCLLILWVHMVAVGPHQLDDLHMHLLKTRLPRRHLQNQLKRDQMVKRDKTSCQRDPKVHDISRRGSAPRLGKPVGATARIEDQQTAAMLRLTLGPMLAPFPTPLLTWPRRPPVRFSHF